MPLESIETMGSLLKGCAFVTGAAAGIGKATASSLARHGCRALAIGDLNVSALKTTADELRSAFPGVEILPLELDTSSESSVNEAVSQTIRQLGRIDYAVNNAGISGRATKSADSELKEWQRTTDVNLTGMWLCSRAETREMLKQAPLSDSPRSNKGVIVNVASMYGLIATPTSVANVSYSATKHGVLGMTKADAIAYAREGIRVNAICPGYIKTPLLEGSTESEVMKDEIRKTPIGRLGDMDEIADCITFMLSPMSSFMYGSGMVVDGGYTIQ